MTLSHSPRFTDEDCTVSGRTGPDAGFVTADDDSDSFLVHMQPDLVHLESETPSSSNTPNRSTPQPTNAPTTTATSRKRKRAPAVKGSSPAPLDQAANGTNSTEYFRSQ